MNVAILGYGKMGKEIEKILLEKGHTVSLKINSKNKDQLHSKNLKDIDVAIEFSGPDTAYANVLLCLENNTAVVCGSTGWLAEIDTVKQKAIDHKTAFLYASNFSLGVNVVFALNEKLASLLGTNMDYAISINETHHTQKKDAPSGTAITIAEQVIEKSENRFTSWSFEEADQALPITSHRKPNVPGTHVICYQSEEDTIEVKHTALSRKGFAIGAVIASEFIHNKEGIFTMKDVLDV